MLNKQQLKIELIKRTPYQLRKIDINEADVIVKTLIGNITCWQHNDITSSLTIKLPSVFNAEYSYIRITEPSDKVTNWFVLGRLFHAPNVWTLTLKRDVIRENWDKIKNATCEIERGYVNSSNPLFYKSEGISGNLTLGKRSKLFDSNLILAYVKTFEMQNNNGSAIPEGIWPVRAGIPGYNNAPIINDDIPALIKIFDCPNKKDRTGYINMAVYRHKNVLGEYYGEIDSEGNYKASSPITGKVFADSGDNPCFTGINGVPTESALNKVKNSVNGFVDFVNSKRNLNIEDIPNWMKKTNGFGDDNVNTYPSSFECVINKGTVDEPNYYKIIFSDTIKQENYNISYIGSDMSDFVKASKQGWVIHSTDYVMNGADATSLNGNFTYHEYTIQQVFLSNTKPSDNSCYTNFPAICKQITSGAYSYNIFAFKVYDNGIGFKANYKAQGDSGQMIASALMGTGEGEARDSKETTNNTKIPSLSGQVVDIQMCPFNEDAIHNLIEEVYDIYAAPNSENKIGEYYLLNSQDVEIFVDYDLTQWKSKGNKKSRVNLSEFRLVCPNNSSVATLNPDIMANGETLRFKMNGTLYPFKPVYKVTPIATNSIIYANQEARDNMLVLGGDFSATQVSNGWSDYLIGNKNVEEVQQASIANQTLNQQLQYDFQQRTIRNQSNMSMTSSILGLLGGITGLTMGNPIMSLLGFLGSGLGVLNTQNNSQIQKEGLDISNSIFSNNIALNQKLFNLQMGNIKALPNTIHKITNGSFDNDYSVMVEEYYSTEEEYKQFDMMIKRTGMSLDCIGRLTDYLSPDYFVFAQMIECDVNNFDDFNEINRELQNGLKILTI